jgi:hypothetical protein
MTIPTPIISSLEDAVALIARDPAIVVGPAATSFRGSLISIAKTVAARFKHLPLQSVENGFFDVVDVVAQLYASESEKFRAAVLSELDVLRPASDLSALTAFAWVAAISLTPDSLFEASLQEHIDHKPTSRVMTLVSSAMPSIPPRTVPVFRMFGSRYGSGDLEKLALSRSEIVGRQVSWSEQIAPFPDYLRQSPLLFVGTEDVVDLAAQLIATLFAGPKPHPTTLLFLRTDPTPAAPIIAGILRRTSARVVVVDATLRELISALEAARGRQKEILFRGPPWGEGLSAKNGLKELRHIADMVELPTDRSLPAKVPRELIDALFRPTASDWRPYALQLPLKRSAEDQFFSKLIEASDLQRGLHVFVCHGAAGIGKTTFLKQLASKLADKGRIVLWMHRVSGDSTSNHVRRLLTATKELLAADKSLPRAMVLIVDDPGSLRVTLPDVIAQVESSQISVLLIVGIRSSDYLVGGSNDTTLPIRPEYELELNYELDALEMAQLPALLKRLGLVSTDDEGKKLAAAVPYRKAADILCSLWFLFPDTRSQFQASLEDEFVRLGNARPAIESLAHNAIKTGDVAKSAYEAVTVASSLDVGLPLEVLVRALEIDYADWVAMADSGRPLWGLLYDEYDENMESVVYRTRNELVTDVLLRLVNGMFGSHAGQYRLLKRLLQACNVGSPAYKTFMHDVLVRSRGDLERILSFEQGLELYDSAIAAFPYADRAVQHHRAIWIRNVGRDLRRAEEELRRALEVPDSPSAAKDEPKEYVHTSIAATMLGRVKAGELDRDSGFESISAHLRQASNTPYFNLNQAHVSANTYFEMAQITSDAMDPVRLQCLNESLGQIERSMQMIGAKGQSGARYQKALILFEDLQGQVVQSITDSGDLVALALKLFAESRNQAGFELNARKLLRVAIDTNNGSDYNLVSEYLKTTFATITAAKQQASVNLHALRADLIVRWRMQRLHGQVDWREFLADMEVVVGSTKFKDDPIRNFYYAVALYQSAKITQSRAIFSSLRRTSSLPNPHVVRCCLTGKEGMPKRFQCVVRASHGRTYAVIDELNDDMPAQGTLEVGPGGTTHVYVGFAANGPIAMTRTLTPDDLLMPKA